MNRVVYLDLYLHSCLYRLKGIKGQRVELLSTRVDPYGYLSKPEAYQRATGILRHHNLKGVTSFALEAKVVYRKVVVVNTMPYEKRILPEKLDPALDKVDARLDVASRLVLKEIKPFSATRCAHFKVCVVSGALCNDPHCSLNRKINKEAYHG